MSDVVLEVKGLTKRFGRGSEAVEAVKDVCLSLHRGEFVAVMGASGSGKSTLLHLIAGLTTPSEGTVTIEGNDIFGMSDNARTVFRRRHVGLIFQAFNLIPTLTGEENIALPILLGEGRGANGNVAHLISRLGLENVRRRHPDTMSGGEQQRVAIGRALVTQPSVILADEPTGSLDSVNGQRLCETLLRLCEENKTTVLMVTHNPVVAFWAQRVIVLRDGRIVREAKKDEFTSLQDFTGHYIEMIEGRPAQLQEAVR